MKPHTMFKVIALSGLVASLGACMSNEASFVKSADGSVQISDSNPENVYETASFYRSQGRKAAKVCAQYEGTNSAVKSELLKLGYTDGDTMMGPGLKMKAPSFIYSPIVMKHTSPCVFRFNSISGREFFQGATAALMELGYSRSSSDTWAAGSKKVKLTGTVTESSYGASSSVAILRQ